MLREQDFYAHDEESPQGDGCIEGAVSEGYSQNEKKGPLVMVVDDDDDNLTLLEYALELINVSFRAVKTGHEAIALARQHQFSLILLDILLPDMNGIQVLQWLRQHTDNGYTPAIAVTALCREGDRDRILESGFTDYLLKPFMLDDLTRMVSQYLSQGGTTE